MSAVPIQVLSDPPAVYVGRGRAMNLTWYGRTGAAVLASGCLVVLVIAAGLAPSGNGFGTHRQLGMSECAWLAKTGLPCPACGMTTSFAWFARGNVLASAYVQPMGAALALIAAMTVWIGGYVAITGRPLHQLLAVVPDRLYLVPLLALAVGAWAWKMYAHLHGIDGWR